MTTPKHAWKTDRRVLNRRIAELEAENVALKVHLAAFGFPGTRDYTGEVGLSTHVRPKRTRVMTPAAMTALAAARARQAPQLRDPVTRRFVSRSVAAVVTLDGDRVE